MFGLGVYIVIYLIN